MNLAVLPLASSMLCALLGLAFFRRPIGARLWGVGSSFSVLVLILALFPSAQSGQVWELQMSAWQAPFGIAFRLDFLSVLLMSVLAALHLGVQIYLCGVQRLESEWAWSVLPHFLMMGAFGALSTADLFNLYVWFEVLVISTLGLMVMSNSVEIRERVFGYATIHLLGSAVFLLGLGFLYNSTGTLNFLDLKTFLSSGHQVGAGFWTSLLFFVLSFCLKAGAFPFAQWLPWIYPRLPIPILALLAGVSTKIGVYVLIRFMAAGLLLAFPNSLNKSLLIAGIVTMVGGVWMAATRRDVREILSTHIVSQIGYMIAVLGLGTIGLAPAVFYLIQNMVVKTALIFCVGVAEEQGADSNLDRSGNLARMFPGLATAFALLALSLAGIPPLSGFWAKLWVISVSWSAASVMLVFFSLAVGLMTFYSMSKVWTEWFQKKAAREWVPCKRPWSSRIALMLPIWAAVVWTVWAGLMPSLWMRWIERAVELMS